jgi:NADPH-dependent glutamate synthase beta subunit-like oxidoreductase
VGSIEELLLVKALTYEQAVRNIAMFDLETNKAIALRLIEVFNGRQLDLLEDVLHPEFRGRGISAFAPDDALPHLFLFIGADPNTGWLNRCVALDAKGFVVTGANLTSRAGQPALLLQTSRTGVFAIGDARSGSTKRVAAAVGEGAAVVAEIHNVLAAE